MGRLAVLSDLHVDINHLTPKEWEQWVVYLQEQAVSHVHIAGDIANDFQLALAFVHYLTRYFPTTFHWGNHEMASLTEVEINQFPDSQFLNEAFFPLTPDTWLLGVNGWYDYGFAQPATRDYARLKQLAWYDRLITRNATDTEIMQQIGIRFRRLMSGVPQQVRVILSTHFVVHPAFIRQYEGPYRKWNQLNAFLGSPLLGQLIPQFPQIQQVVFGHTHHRMSPTKIGEVTYHCRPFGYYYEWPSTRQFVREQAKEPIQSMRKARQLLTREAAAFESVRPTFISREIAQAVTFIDYDETIR